MINITVSKDAFDDIAPMLKPYLKDHCNYCGRKIKKDTFGILAKQITCCDNMVCLSQAIVDMEEIKNSKEEKSELNHIPQDGIRREVKQPVDEGSRALGDSKSTDDKIGDVLNENY